MGIHDQSSDDESRSATNSSDLDTSILPISTLAVSPPSLPEPMPLFPSSSAPKLIPVFVASLGNPQPYLNTLHSAGHTVLTAIAATERYQPWRPFSGGKLATSTSSSFSFLSGFSATSSSNALPALWKCGAVMNVSGPAVKKAYAKWKVENGIADGEGRLVIVHDELERELGSVSVRTDHKASARGHNGLKSVMASMPHEKFIRIGVGIGRPASRERDAVSNYVLRKTKPNEVAALEGAAREVSRVIAEIYEGEIR